MEDFKVFQNPYPQPKTSITTKYPSKAAQKKIDTKTAASQIARDRTQIDAGLINLNKTHGLATTDGQLTYDPLSNKGGQRKKRPTRRSRKTKSKRRKTRKRR